MASTSTRFAAFRFLLLTYCCFFALQTQAQIRVHKSATRAVVIGISNYLNISKLRFADRDAEAFAEYLRSPAGGSVPDEHLMLLTNEKATQAQIGGALSWLITESQEGDQAIIYFSGHGDVETQISNLGYLLAYDANKTTYMAGGAIPVFALQSIMTSLSEGKQVQVLLVADACHAGNLAGSAIGGSKTTALALASPFNNAVKIMSCGADELSNEGDTWGGGHSVFTYYLLDGLRGLADLDENRSVSVREIERFLEDSVRHATATLDRKQTPATYGSKDQIVAKVDAATLAALRRKYQPPPVAAPVGKGATGPGLTTDSAVLRLYREFEDALRTGRLLEPDKAAAYTIYQQIKDQAAVRSYKNLMRNDLAAKLQDEAQKAINDYLSADPREMRRRWGLDDSRYLRYPEYLEKAAELLGEQNFAYTQIKAKEYYFSGLNLRLQGERSKVKAEKDSLYIRAASLQERTLNIDSTAAYAYNELGLLARRRGQYEPSIYYFNKAVHFSPTWVLPWANLCGSYNDFGNSENALLCGRKALLLDSTFALAHYNLAYTLESIQEHSLSLFHIKKTIDYSPDYANAYFNLGLNYANQGDYIMAEKMLVEYIQLVPDDPEGFQNLGEITKNLGNYNLSEDYFLKAIILDPNYSQAYLGLSELYLSVNNLTKSDEWFKKFIVLSPEDPKGYYYLANRNHQNTALALKYLESAFKYGFKNFERLANESRLSAVRKTPEYLKLIRQYFPDKD